MRDSLFFVLPIIPGRGKQLFENIKGRHRLKSVEAVKYMVGRYCRMMKLT